MLNIEVENPMRGAAWRVLYERLYPHHCVTHERKAEIKAEIDSILEWAKSQHPDTREAYDWSAKRILSDIDRQMKVVDMNNQVNDIYGKIARPPS